MDKRKLFIEKILYDVSAFLKENNSSSSSSSYSYKKGYLAEADVLANDFITTSIENQFTNDHDDV